MLARVPLAHTISVRVPRALETLDTLEILETLETLVKTIEPAGCKGHSITGCGFRVGNRNKIDYP